jgi:hypothetical protein
MEKITSGARIKMKLAGGEPTSVVDPSFVALYRTLSNSKWLKQISSHAYAEFVSMMRQAYANQLQTLNTEDALLGHLGLQKCKTSTSVEWKCTADSVLAVLKFEMGDMVPKQIHECATRLHLVHYSGTIVYALDSDGWIRVILTGFLRRKGLMSSDNVFLHMFIKTFDISILNFYPESAEVHEFERRILDGRRMVRKGFLTCIPITIMGEDGDVTVHHVNLMNGIAAPTSITTTSNKHVVLALSKHKEAGQELAYSEYVSGINRCSERTFHGLVREQTTQAETPPGSA